MPIPRRLVPLLAVAVALATLAADPHRAAAASCAGNSHLLTLSDGAVTPGSGTTATKFAFSVTYVDNDSCVPDRIVVVVIGVREFNLSYVGGGLQSGATFERTVTLPAGKWAYRFEASSGSGPGRRNVKLAKVDPPRVIVVDPTPDPTKPVATSTARPTAVPPTAKPAVPTPPPPSPVASAAPAATPAEGTYPPSSERHLVPPALPSLPTAQSTNGPSSGASLAMTKLVVSGIGTIGGLVLFAVLGRRLLRTTPVPELAAAPRRRRDDRPIESEPGT